MGVWVLGTAGCLDKDYQTQAPVTTGDLLELDVNVGLKTGEQLRQTMSTVTGIALSQAGNDSVNQAYTSVVGSLPIKNDLTKFSDATERAYIVLASAFCKKIVDLNVGDLSRSRLFADLSFGNGINASDAQINFAINAMVTNFWLRSPSSLSDEQRAELIALFKEAGQGRQAPSKDGALGLCTAMLSAFPVVSI